MRLTEAFRDQAVHCEGLGSPFMAQLMRVLADHLTADHGHVSEKLFAWPGDVSPRGASLPLRIAGGLHAMQLRGYSPLDTVYPPMEVDDDALWSAVSDALHAGAAFLMEFVDAPPQTNELRRAATFRAAGHWLTARYGLPLELCELGASAGLNLNWDQYALRAGDAVFGPDPAVLTLSPEWRGPLPAAGRPSPLSLLVHAPVP